MGFQRRAILWGGPLWAAVLVLAACDSPTSPPEDLPVTRLTRGDFSALTTAQRLVIRSQGELDAAWAAMFQTQSHPPEKPAVDFTQDIVLLVGAGAKPTNGFCISVESATVSRRVMTVTVVSTSGVGVLPVVTHPFEVVRVPRRTESVTFIEKALTGQCG
jgi:hypothetical protein